MAVGLNTPCSDTATVGSGIDGAGCWSAPLQGWPDLCYLPLRCVFYLSDDSTIISFMKGWLWPSAGFSSFAVIFQLFHFANEKLVWWWKSLPPHWLSCSCILWNGDLMLVNVWLFWAAVPHVQPVSDCIPLRYFLFKWKPFYQNSKYLEAKVNEDSCILLSEISQVFCGSNCKRL